MRIARGVRYVYQNGKRVGKRVLSNVRRAVKAVRHNPFFRKQLTNLKQNKKVQEYAAKAMNHKYQDLVLKCLFPIDRGQKTKNIKKLFDRVCDVDSNLCVMASRAAEIKHEAEHLARQQAIAGPAAIEENDDENEEMLAFWGWGRLQQTMVLHPSPMG